MDISVKIPLIPQEILEFEKGPAAGQRVVRESEKILVVLAHALKVSPEELLNPKPGKEVKFQGLAIHFLGPCMMKSPDGATSFHRRFLVDAKTGKIHASNITASLLQMALGSDLALYGSQEPLALLANGKIAFLQLKAPLLIRDVLRLLRLKHQYGLETEPASDARLRHVLEGYQQGFAANSAGLKEEADKIVAEAKDKAAAQAEIRNLEIPQILGRVKKLTPEESTAIPVFIKPVAPEATAATPKTKVAALGKRPLSFKNFWDASEGWRENIMSGLTIDDFYGCLTGIFVLGIIAHAIKITSDLDSQKNHSWSFGDFKASFIEIAIFVGAILAIHFVIIPAFSALKCMHAYYFQDRNAEISQHTIAGVSDEELFRIADQDLAYTKIKELAKTHLALDELIKRKKAILIMSLGKRSGTYLKKVTAALAAMGYKVAFIGSLAAVGEFLRRHPEIQATPEYVERVFGSLAKSVRHEGAEIFLKFIDQCLTDKLIGLDQLELFIAKCKAVHYAPNNLIGVRPFLDYCLQKGYVQPKSVQMMDLWLLLANPSQGSYHLEPKIHHLNRFWL